MQMLDEIIKRVRNLDSDQQEEILGILRKWQAGRQREYQRLETKVEIDVAVGDRVIQTDAKNISASGVFINTSGKFEPKKDVRLVFSIPGYDKPFKLQGVIVRVEKNGLGIRFEKISPYFKNALDDILWENKKIRDNFS